jgi:hypothetical protein
LVPKVVDFWCQKWSIFVPKSGETPNCGHFFGRVEKRRFFKTVGFPVLSATKKKGHECQKNALFFLDGRKFFWKHPPFGPVLGRSSGKRFSLESGLIKVLTFFCLQTRWPFFEIWSRFGGPGAGFWRSGLGHVPEVRNGWETGFGAILDDFLGLATFQPKSAQMGTTPCTSDF